MKKKIVTIIAIIAFILIGAGILFFVLGNKIGDTTDNNSSIVEEAMIPFEENISDLNNYLAYSFPISDLNTFDGQKILLFGYNKVDNINKNQGFTADELKAAIVRYFGSDFSYQDVDIKCPLDDGVMFKYENGNYIAVAEHNHYRESFGRSRHYILSKDYDKKTDTITVKANVLYADFANYYEPLANYYASYDDSKNKKNVLYTDPQPDEEKDAYDEVYEKVKDRLNVFTYVLKKDSSGNYVFTSITVE